LSTVIHVLLVIVVFVGLGWVAVFGGVGSALGYLRDTGKMRGFVLGVLLGPIGWVVVLWPRGGAKAKQAPTTVTSAPGTAIPPSDLPDPL
jgi:hypothetical protein